MTAVPAWFAYSLVVGLFTGLAARVGEAALRAAGRPGRWAWAGGMGLTVALPALGVLGTLGWTRPVPAVPGAVIPLVPLAVAFDGADRGGPSLDAILLWGWVVLAALVLLYVYRAHRRLEQGGAAGRRVLVGGVGVVVTRCLGPAVYGIRRPSIVVPEWALGLDVRFRRLMLLHEGEHVRAGDGRLVHAGLLLAAAVPWNLALWWQLRRMRTAVELDCDERVLRRVRDPLNYGNLLLEVGRRRSEPVVGVALAERTTMLELRLQRITAVARRPRVRRALWLGGAAVLLFGVAAFSRTPGSPGPAIPGDVRAEPPGLPLAPVTAVPEPSQAQDPYFTPFTVAPRLKNPQEVARALEAAYPSVLKDAGVAGRAVLWFFLDEKGSVRRTRVKDSSGYPALDAAAVSVAAKMQFTPAYNRDEAVPVWVSIPIVFGPASDTPPLPPPSPPPATGRQDPRDRGQLGQGPTFTPFTVAPRLMNPAQVAETLEANYPPLLRDAGLGGSVNVWFFIDEQGRVVKSQVNQSSGYPALDEAALRVAETMGFTPAYNRDEAVPVWVSIPIVFHAK